jgi:hypothetical protein
MWNDIKIHLAKNKILYKNAAINIIGIKPKGKLIDLTDHESIKYLLYSKKNFTYWEPIIEKQGKNKLCTYLLHN